MTGWYADRQPVHVTGGADGVAADCAELALMGRRFGGVGAETSGSALSLHGYLADPALLSSALLDPVGFAEFEYELLAALDVWQGLSWAAAECGGIDLELQLAARAYAEVDRLAGDVHDSVVGVVDLPGAVGHGAATLARTGDPVRAVYAVLADDPQVADLAVNALGLPGLLSATARLLPDGRGLAVDTGVDRAPVATAPPRRLTDLVGDLDRRNGDRRHGEIDVRIITGPDGRRRVVVDITGTKSWALTPTPDITSLTTNGRALVGERTAYEQGVIAALRDAGVGPADEVMLVGHSEGGLVAVNTARDVTRSGEFDVTHVITAGAPIGLVVGQLPSRVQVLALENTSDVVPHLDGVANPDRINVTTASAHEGDGTIGGDHSIGGAYLPLAADVQDSTDAAVLDFLRSAGGYLHGTAVVTHTYQVIRRY